MDFLNKLIEDQVKKIEESDRLLSSRKKTLKEIKEINKDFTVNYLKSFDIENEIVIRKFENAPLKKEKVNIFYKLHDSHLFNYILDKRWDFLKISIENNFLRNYLMFLKCYYAMYQSYFKTNIDILGFSVQDNRNLYFYFYDEVDIEEKAQQLRSDGEGSEIHYIWIEKKDNITVRISDKSVDEFLKALLLDQIISKKQYFNNVKNSFI